ncbi:MAG TPA: neutral zinc metallopeptidase [Mucilaginibacter sp.]|nr:neutral zinc metallopeptidase [Mucilaginibacter sp.]
MSSSRKKSRKNNASDTREINRNDTRAHVALIAGIIVVIGLAFYLFTAAYPLRLFKDPRNTEPMEQPAVLINSHPVLPDSPVKTSCEQLFTSTGKVWTKLLVREGKHYTKPALQFFQDTITAESSGIMGPLSGSFYCTPCNTMYVDLAVFDTLQKYHPSTTHFSEGYIIAHQAGHRIQQLLGIANKIETARTRMADSDFIKLQNKVELQADYYAGVWAHYAYDGHTSLDETDMELAISLLDELQIDKLQKRYNISMPDANRGLNADERTWWFYKGYQTGDVVAANQILSDKDFH